MKAEFQLTGALDLFLASLEDHAKQNPAFRYHYHTETPDSVTIWPAEQGEGWFDVIGRSIKLTLWRPEPEPGTWYQERLPYDRLIVWCDNSEWQRLAPLWVELRNTLERWEVIGERLSSQPSEGGVSRGADPMGTEGNEHDSAPWMEVADKGYSREIARLWHEGYTAKEIGYRLDRCGKTISNHISNLRSAYGAEVIPYRKKRT